MFGFNSIVYFYPKNECLYYLTDSSNEVKRLEVEEKAKSTTPNIPFWATYDFFISAKKFYKKATQHDSFVQRILRKKAVLMVYPPDVSLPERRFLRDFCELMGASEVYMAAENVGIFSRGRFQACFNISDTGRNYVLSYLSGDFNAPNAVEIIHTFDKERFTDEQARKMLHQSFPNKATSLPIYFSGDRSTKFNSMRIKNIRPQEVLENISFAINSVDQIDAAKLNRGHSYASNPSKRSGKDLITRFKAW